MSLAANYRCLMEEIDPLFPFDRKFQKTVALLETFQLQDAASPLTFKTRSPLVILLTPIFQKIQDRLHIIIPIEVINDPLHKQLEGAAGLQGLPRPSERLSAAKTLHQLGFSVELRLQPYVGSNFQAGGLPKRAMEVFANICDSSASKISLGAVLGTEQCIRVNTVFEQVLARGLKVPDYGL